MGSFFTWIFMVLFLGLVAMGGWMMVVSTEGIAIKIFSFVFLALPATGFALSTLFSGPKSTKSSGSTNYDRFM